MNLQKNIFRAVLVMISMMWTITAYGQQRAQYTQYIMNNYILNPAAGGVSNLWDLKAGFRTQWTGFAGAPKTFFVSGHGSIGYPHARVRGSESKPHHGVGGYLYHDETGP